jgi:hypothetical protein
VNHVWRAWNADGTDFTTVPQQMPPPGPGIPAMPVGLDLNADGTLVYYGASALSSSASVTRGTAINPVLAGGTTNAMLVRNLVFPSVTSGRLVGTYLGDTRVLVQQPGAVDNENLVPWLDVAAYGGKAARRTDVSADATMAAVEYETTTTAPYGLNVRIVSIAGLGGAPTGAIDCRLPGVGQVTNPSWTADATTLAWQDDEGVKVGPRPTGTGGSTCAFATPPRLVAAGGVGASISPTTLATATPPPTPPSSPTIDVALPRKVKASKLRKGIKVTVTVPAGGVVKLRGTVKGSVLGLAGKRGRKQQVVAEGRVRADAAGTLSVKVRLTKKAAKKVKRLPGARLSVTVTQGPASAKGRVRLT